MGQFASKYDIGDLVVYMGSECVVQSISFHRNAIEPGIYTVMDGDVQVSGIRQEHLKPAPKEMFVAVSSSGVIMSPVCNSINKAHSGVASNHVGTTYTIMKLIEIEE